MRKIYLVFIFILCISCSKIVDDGSSTDPNLIRISDNVCFDNNLKRYVYTGNLSKTKSDPLCHNDELTSMESENKLLDSLSDDAHSKGLKLFIIYSKQNLEGRMLSKASVDDSLGINDGTVDDTCVVTGTLCGTLKK